MTELHVAVIGTGMCGSRRAQTASRNGRVGRVDIAEIDADRRASVAAAVGAVTAVEDYRQLLDDPGVDAVFISTAPESTHYPITMDALNAGKHVFLEKPISLTLEEADEMIALAGARDLRLAIGYSQRFSEKQAVVHRSIKDGELGDVVSMLISRHITKEFGQKIDSRSGLSPAAMEASHDIDFALWCLDPDVPVRVTAHGAGVDAIRGKGSKSDVVFINIEMASGAMLAVSAGWLLPQGYPNYGHAWIEVVGSDGVILADDSHRDVIINTDKNGIELPLSTMPGEWWGHVYVGPMQRETLDFIDAVVDGRPPLVTPGIARRAMEVYQAADLSIERRNPVDLSA